MFHRILAIVEATNPNPCVLSTAFAYAKTSQAELRLLQLLPYYRSDDLPEAASWHATEHPAGINVSTMQLVDASVQKIADIAQTWNADLIVMHGDSARTDHRPSLNANEVAARAGCSVLSVEQLMENAPIAIRMQVNSTPRDPLASTRRQLESLLAHSI